MTLYGSEGWGFESLQARTPHRLPSNRFARTGELTPRSHPFSCPIEQLSSSLCVSNIGWLISQSGSPGEVSAVSGRRPIATTSLLSRHEKHARVGVGSSAATGSMGSTRLIGAAPGQRTVRVSLDHRARRSSVREAARDRWAAEATLVRSRGEARPAIVVGDLLREWLTPTTGGGHRPFPATSPWCGS